jgi:hypothetical protein
MVLNKGGSVMATVLERNNKCVYNAYQVLKANNIYAEVWCDSELPVIYVQIDNGDWKHDHLRARLLLEEAKFKFLGETEVGESLDDCYSAVHKYSCSSVSLKEENKMTKYLIYQLKDMRECAYGFMKWDFAATHGFDLYDYEVVYEGELLAPVSNELSALENLFEIFNMNHPSDFKGHSLSVSDVVCINDRYFYCDSFGWTEITTEVAA